LLMAILCIGGMYSKHEHEVTQMKILLDLMEFHIFTSPPFNDNFGADESSSDFEKIPEWQQYRLQEIQGGHLMVVVQYWTGNPGARKRARRQRFSRVVNVARSLRISACENGPAPYIQDEQTFRSWVARESLSRTINTLMLLDNAFVIFNNMPSRFEWPELGDLELPCELMYFENATYDDMYIGSRLPPVKLKVRDAFQKLFVPELHDDDLACIKDGTLNALDMQILIHWLYSHIWRQTLANATIGIPSVPAATVTKPLKIALQNWKTFWDTITASTPEAEWVALGFQRSAESYWNLTKAILHAFEKKGARAALAIASDVDETASHLKKLLS